MKKCTPYSLLEQILFPDQHKMTQVSCPVEKTSVGQTPGLLFRPWSDLGLTQV
jgi:hypothetical protein